MRLRIVAILAFALSLHSQPAPEFTDALARAAREHKPLLVFYKPPRCSACLTFESGTLSHPTIARRLPKVVLITQPARDPAVAFFDRTGTLRAKWDAVPNTISFAAILDTVIAAAPDFERAAAQGPVDGEIEAAIGLTKLGRRDEARKAIEHALANGSPETRQLAIIGRAMIDLNVENAGAAIGPLEALIPKALTPDIAATAWIAIGDVRRIQSDVKAATHAYETALKLAGDTPTGAAANARLTALRELATSQQRGPIRIVPMHEQIVTGRHMVRTTVASADVARVVFSVDGKTKTTIERPPFSTVIDFGRIPQAQTIRAVAQDAKGKELGRADFVVNNAGETFWLRLTEPREGPAAGSVRVSTVMRTPAAHRVRRMLITWNDAERAVLTAEPWQTEISVPENELGIVRAVAELDDGRTAEDAVLLNASGYTDRADVPLVELPVTIKGGAVQPSEVFVKEGTTRREIESITSGAESPLTVGMVIDTSESMLKTLPDVQEAAIRFLDTALGAKDRAFLISFDSEARLLQIPTTERARLQRQILALRPKGSTALYDAMILGLLQFEGVKGRRALIVFSDGGDLTSRYDKGDVAELSRRSNIPIYFIGAPSLPENRAAVTMSAATAMWYALMGQIEQFVAPTGGRVHRLMKLEGLEQVYKDIEADLRAQSLVLIRTDAGRSENDWRKIDVSVAGRADVRAPAGYYAPW